MCMRLAEGNAVKYTGETSHACTTMSSARSELIGRAEVSKYSFVSLYVLPYF